jgi:glyoxylase-like metal-dependent hydrolase (beta-lactamase superfamily II)
MIWKRLVLTSHTLQCKGDKAGGVIRSHNQREPRRVLGRSAMCKPTRIVLVCLLLALIPALLIAEPKPSVTIPVEVEQISDRVLVARCPIGSNVTAINTRQGIVIVDTHLSPGLMRVIRSKIESVFGRREFPFVINTHGHWDHCSGNQVFPEATIIGHASCPIFMRYHRPDLFGTMWSQEELLARDRERLESNDEPDKASELRAKIRTREQIVSDLKTVYVSTPPTVTFQDRYTLDVGDVTFHLIYCGPAHTITDIFVYIPGERIIITGDVFSSPTSFSFAVSPLNNIPAVLEAVDFALEQGVDIVVPGHGRLMSGEDLRGLRDRLTKQYAAQSGVVSAARTLEQTIEEGGVEEAKRLFRSMTSDTSTAGYMSEEEFYLLGNRFVDKSKLEAAATVFELAAGIFPESSLIFGGLGRTCLIRGDTLSAMSAYERAYELAPYNRQAQEMLRWLRGK